MGIFSGIFGREGNENEGNEHEANEHGGRAAGLTLNGREGDHGLDGGDGDDVLTGSGGALTLTGGAGVNTFNVVAGEDTLADAKETDHINISAGATAVQNLTLTSANYSANTVNNGTLVLNAPSTAAVAITGSSGHDRIHGGDKNDSLNGGDGDDELDGGSGDDQIAGGNGNDSFHESVGSDVINGGTGLNLVTYAGSSAAYTFTRDADGTAHVHKPSAATDTLYNVQRLHFADTNVAMDIDGHAGVTAKILGAVFGKEALSNAAYAGIGLRELDNGRSYESLMQLALNAKGATTNTDAVNVLWTNLFGAAPTAAQAKQYTDMLDSGAMTAAGLGVVAADSSVNTGNIGLVGLQQAGLHFV